MHSDDIFAAQSRHLFKEVQKYVPKGSDDISLDDMAKKDDPDYLYPPTLNIYMGATRTAQNRRAAYEKARIKAGKGSPSEWARSILDAAANFKEEK